MFLRQKIHIYQTLESQNFLREVRKMCNFWRKFFSTPENFFRADMEMTKV